jgi:hypothetical protein
MEIESITIVIEPPRVPYEDPELLALLLREQTRAPVRTLDGSLPAAPGRGFIIWKPARRSGVALCPTLETFSPVLRARLVVYRGQDLKPGRLLEDYGVAAEFDNLSPCLMTHFEGRRSVAEKIGASLSVRVGEPKNSRFVGMVASHHDNSPGKFLVAYLEEYARELENPPPP